MSANWERTQSKAWHAVEHSNWQEAERHFRKAVELSRDFDPAVHFAARFEHAHSLKMAGRLAEAEHACQQMRKLAICSLGPELAVHFENLLISKGLPGLGARDVVGALDADVGASYWEQTACANEQSECPTSGTDIACSIGTISSAIVPSALDA